MQVANNFKYGQNVFVWLWDSEAPNLVEGKITGILDANVAFSKYRFRIDLPNGEQVWRHQTAMYKSVEEAKQAVEGLTIRQR